MSAALNRGLTYLCRMSAAFNRGTPNFYFAVPSKNKFGFAVQRGRARLSAVLPPSTAFHHAIPYIYRHPMGLRLKQHTNTKYHEKVQMTNHNINHNFYEQLLTGIPPDDNKIGPLIRMAKNKIYTYFWPNTSPPPPLSATQNSVGLLWPFTIFMILALCWGAFKTLYWDFSIQG